MAMTTTSPPKGGTIIEPVLNGGSLMDRDTRNAAVAALCILLLFGLFAYWLPTLMMAAGRVSTVLAAAVAILFVACFFMIFWLRARQRRGKGG